jgi:hypothetical protein
LPQQIGEGRWRVDSSSARKRIDAILIAGENNWLQRFR